MQLIEIGTKSGLEIEPPRALQEIFGKSYFQNKFF